MSAGPRVLMCGVILFAAYCTASSLHTEPDQVVAGNSQTGSDKTELQWQAPSVEDDRALARLSARMVDPDGGKNSPLESASQSITPVLPAPPMIPASGDRNFTAGNFPARTGTDGASRAKNTDRVPSAHAPHAVQTVEFEDNNLQVVSRIGFNQDVRNSPHDFEYHTVRVGESLQSIAKRYLGDSSRYLDVYRSNQDVLDSPADAPVGTVLKIDID